MTRLALEVAHGILARYRDGVWLVELGMLADRDLVAQPVTSALVAAVSSRQILIVLDNCEHLLDAVCSTRGHPAPCLPQGSTTGHLP